MSAGSFANNWSIARCYNRGRLEWQGKGMARFRSPDNRNWLVSGDARRPVEAEEMWTFVRGRGGNWMLSAIQQV